MRTALVIAALLLGVGPVAAAEFGAIAYSLGDNKYGRSWKYSSRAKAEAEAKKYCAEAGGKNCQTAVWLEDGCGSVARSPSTARIKDLGVSWGYGNQNAARKRALVECGKRNSGQCRIIVSVCTSGK